MEYQLSNAEILMYAIAGARTEAGIYSGEDVGLLDRDIEELEHRLEQPGVQEAFQANGLHVERLDYKSTDAFLVTVKDGLTREQLIYIRDYVRSSLGVKSVLVMDSTATLSIMRRDDEDAERGLSRDDF